MPIPRFCPNPECRNHHHPLGHWRVRFGSYQTIAHGTVRRYRCCSCGKTMGDQTESVHYYAKRRLPLRAVVDSLIGGSCQREIARRYGFSTMAVHNAILRLGRQAMAAQLLLLHDLPPRPVVVFDGLRSCVTSHDYPCDITTVVEPAGEMILSMTHAVMHRGGRMTELQRTRTAAKRRIWAPPTGTVMQSISLIGREIGDYLRPPIPEPARINTDKNPLYYQMISKSPLFGHFRKAGLLQHRRISSEAPRTMANPLFPVNYVDRLLRHRVKEHTRESIAFGRHSVMQMHRAWIFAWDHNVRREHRVKEPFAGIHADWTGVPLETIGEATRSFFTRRFRPRHCLIPESIHQVWLGLLETPPVRWRKRQSGTSVRIPRFARRDLSLMYQQGC
jgi:transposase-like protein